MRKFILTLTCLGLLAMGGSRAAADSGTPVSGPGLRLGVEGGINLANLNGQNVNDVFGSRLGFVGGAFADVSLTSSFAIQPEVLYEQKGGKLNGSAYQLD